MKQIRFLINEKAFHEEIQLVISKICFHHVRVYIYIYIYVYIYSALSCGCARFQQKLIQCRPVPSRHVQFRSVQSLG